MTRSIVGGDAGCRRDRDTADYDPVGNVSATVDGRGYSTLFAYDAVNGWSAPPMRWVA